MLSVHSDQCDKGQHEECSRDICNCECHGSSIQIKQCSCCFRMLIPGDIFTEYFPEDILLCRKCEQGGNFPMEGLE